MARTKRGQLTVSQILSAARSHLLEVGPVRFSLREVARRADLAPSALYNHFRDKDELIIALAMESVGGLAMSLSAVPAAPAPARLAALASAYIRFADEHPEEYAVIFDCLVNPPRTWDEYATVAHPFSLIVSTCQQGLDEGSIGDPDGVGAAGLAYAMWALVDGHVHLRSKHLAAVTGPYDRMFSAGLRALLDGCPPPSDHLPATESDDHREDLP